VLTPAQLVRPEFHASADQQSATLSLVGDVADLLERLAVSPAHTPALYSAFLRALLANKLHPPAPEPAVDVSMPPPPQPAPPQQDTDDGLAYGYLAAYPDYQFAGELGPALDVSTFPPTMGPPPPQDDMLSANALFATGFWDNVLVPGTCVRCGGEQAMLTRVLCRVRESDGGPQRRVCVRDGRERLHHPAPGSVAGSVRPEYAVPGGPRTCSSDQARDTLSVLQNYAPHSSHYPFSPSLPNIALIFVRYVVCHLLYVVLPRIFSHMRLP
jgi:hypothetical protein